VRIACQAQLVNVIAPIRTEPGGPAWRQTIFDPFAATARHARGDVLVTPIESPTQPTARYGDVPVLDAVATIDDEHGAVTIILVNRSLDASLTSRVDTRGFAPLRVVERLELCDSDPDAYNSPTQPDRVRVHSGPPVDVDESGFTLALPPTSWTMVRLATVPS
jgi:alpha-N-arabinofuranosidase